ncbi:MAG: hypothetical protein WCG34_12770, partial [Leptolinea sp.]
MKYSFFTSIHRPFADARHWCVTAAELRGRIHRAAGVAALRAARRGPAEGDRPVGGQPTARLSRLLLVIGGLAALARHFGVNIGENAEPSAPAPQPAAVAPPAPAIVATRPEPSAQPVPIPAPDSTSPGTAAMSVTDAQLEIRLLGAMLRLRMVE